MKTSHTVKGESRVIRIPREVHHAAKIQAARECIPLAALATTAIEQELLRRQATTTPDRQP